VSHLLNILYKHNVAARSSFCRPTPIGERDFLLVGVLSTSILSTRRAASQTLHHFHTTDSASSSFSQSFSSGEIIDESVFIILRKANTES